MKKKTAFATVLFAFSIMTSFAQVTVGVDLPPQKAALLDIKSKDDASGQISSENGGLLLPRVQITDFTKLGVFSKITGIDTPAEGIKHRGLTVYNIGNANINEGIYVWDGIKWQKAGVNKEIRFFYMPSIEIDLSQSSPLPINLYDKYKAQFLKPKVASSGAPEAIPFYVDPLDLYYYITDYDSNIFASIAISNTGLMTYTLKDPLPADVCCSHINIVFVIK